MQSISLADRLVLEPAPHGAIGDEVLCAGIRSEENLATAALSAFRLATGWDAPPLRLTIEKRIPIAAGLAGGSADAAATLRLARAASGLADEQLLRAWPAHSGPTCPHRWRRAAGWPPAPERRCRRCRRPPSRSACSCCPSPRTSPPPRSTREADRLRLTRDRDQLLARRGAMVAALGAGEPLPADPGLLGNDLQRAALSLCPEIARALLHARGSGAEHVLVSGSGPTVLGLFASASGRSGPERAAGRRAGSGGTRAGADRGRLGARRPSPPRSAADGDPAAA